MNIEQIFDETLDPHLQTWLRKWPDAISALNHIDELFADMTEQTILGEVSENVTITGPVYIGKGSKISPFVTLEGPVYIGENVEVLPHALIRKQAYVGSNCVVGHSADIKRSLCLNGSKMQCGVFVGDSVIGSRSRVGSGVIIANRKFNQSEISYKDETGTLLKSGRTFFGALVGRSCRIGANVVTYPGTVIQEHTWIGAGCILQGILGPDQFISVKQELRVLPKSRVDLQQ